MTGAMSEDKFREILYQKYREHFDHFYRLFSFAQEAVHNYRSFTTSNYDSSLNLIFGRAYKSIDSIRRLCEVASCEDAAIILRSLLNLLAVTRWISLDPVPRSNKYLAWYWVGMHADAREFGPIVPPSSIPLIEGRYQAIKSLFEYKDAKGQTRMPHKWYQPEANSIRDLFVQVGLEKQYDEGYKPLSGIEHSDSSAFFAMVASMDKTGDERRIEIHSDLLLPHYLRNGFQYFADIFRICNQTIPLANAEQLEQIASAGLGFYKTDMVARGMTP